MKVKRRIFRSDTIKIMLLRMWTAGAVCFFAAWGRAGTEEVGNSYSLNLIADLILIMFLGDWIIVNPIVKLAFNQNSAAGTDKKGWRIFLSSLLRLIKVMFSLLFVVETYYFLNVLFIRLFSLEAQAVPVPLEPFFFGIFYGFYYQFFEFLQNRAERYFGKKRLKAAFFP
jgi:hypothetical protein